MRSARTSLVIAAAVGILGGAGFSILAPRRAQAQGLPSPGNFPGGATASTVTATSCMTVTPGPGTGNVSLALPSSGNSNTGGIDFASAAACGVPGTVNLGYNTGTGFLTVNGAGFLLNGTQLNLGSSGATRSIEIQQSAGNIGLDLQSSGAKLCLANGTDCVSDSGGNAAFSSSVSAAISMSAQNMSASNSVSATTNLIVGSAEQLLLSGSGTGRFREDLTGSSDSAVSFDLIAKGAGDVQLPRIANASLLSCTASTEDATHSQAGAIAFDSTNNAKVTCNGTRWVYDNLWTTCTMAAGTTCTASVPASTVCICEAQSGATASAFSCGVSGTTATCTASAANSLVWNIHVH